MRIVLRLLLDLVGIIGLFALGVYVLAKSYWVAQLTNAIMDTNAWLRLEYFLGVNGVDDEIYLTFVMYLVIALVLSISIVALSHRGLSRLRGTNQQ